MQSAAARSRQSGSIPSRAILLLLLAISIPSSFSSPSTPLPSSWPPFPFNRIGTNTTSPSFLPPLNSLKAGTSAAFSQILSQQLHLPPTSPLLIFSLLPPTTSVPILRSITLATATLATTTGLYTKLKHKLPPIITPSGHPLPPTLPLIPTPPSPLPPPRFKNVFTLTLHQALTRRQTVAYDRAATERSAVFSTLMKGAPSSKKKGPPTPVGGAVVTGACGGLGREIAIELARHRVPLLLTGRTLAPLQTLADEIMTCYHVPCKTIAVDLTGAGAAREIKKCADEWLPDVDIVVSNAGNCKRGRWTGFDEESHQVNVIAPQALTGEFLPAMIKKGRGRIMFVSSLMGSMPGGSGVVGYTAGKSFLSSFGEGLSQELVGTGVGVTVSTPGAIKQTAFFRHGLPYCMRVPGYSMTPQKVARISVKSMLIGDWRVTPGVVNQLVEFGQHCLPRRLVQMGVELAWQGGEVQAAPIAEKEVEEIGPVESVAMIHLP